MAKERNLLWLVTMACSVLALLCVFPDLLCGKKVKWLKLVYIPPGEFMMGMRGLSQHKVRITKGFYMGAYEVTQAQWQEVMATNPSHYKGVDLPVDTVSWEDATEFCRKLSQKEGKTYRLPTDAEWEYACRAGTTTDYYFGDGYSQVSHYAWYGGNSGHKSHPVGKKKPNGFGLYDMTGNVWEWCSDWYDEGYYSQSPVDDPKGPSTGSSGQYRVLRGGGCGGDAWPVASRSDGSPTYRYDGVGFRVVQDLD